MADHPWINESLDAEEMEAVLVATNPLPEWDSAATVRAFQTYLWSNASTSSDHLSFAHDETGVIVAFDGDVVGIECGHGSLPEALPDLISVLHSLGWRKADVYCLSAHVQELMADIGRAIPASMDFDVQEAKRGELIADVPAAQQLRDHTRSMLRAAADTAGKAPSDEVLVSMINDLDRPSIPAPVAIELDDGNDQEGGDDEVFVATSVAAGGSSSQATIPALQVNPASQTANAPTQHSIFEASDEGPRVFEFLPEAGLPSAIPVPQAVITPSVESIEIRPAQQTSFPQPQETPISENPSPTVPEATGVAEVSEDQYPIETGMVVNESSSDETEALAVLAPNFDEQINDVIRAGNAAFYFPADTESLVNLRSVLSRVLAWPGMEAAEVVDLWPGAVGQPHRWNVVGEVDPLHPLFAQTWVRWAFGNTGSSVGIAQAVIKLSEAQHKGLRDLSGMLADRSESVESILSAFDLVRAGDAFVDVTGVEGSPIEVFTVRASMRGKPRVFVVHQDALDGDFAQWIIKLLRQVVEGFAASRWYEQ